MKQVINKQSGVLVIGIYNNQLTNFIFNELNKKLNFTETRINCGNDKDAIVINYNQKRIAISSSKIYRDDYTKNNDIEVLNITSLLGIESMISYATIDKVSAIKLITTHVIGGLYGQDEVQVQVSSGKITALIDGGVDILYSDLTALIRTKELKVGPWAVNNNDIVKIGCKFVTYSQLKKIKDAYLKVSLSTGELN